MKPGSVIVDVSVDQGGCIETIHSTTHSAPTYVEEDKTPADAEKSLHNILTELGVLQSSANVSRIDLYVDFVSHQNMEEWTREAWVTRAGSISSYAINKQFTGWAIGMGGVIAARLYDKLYLMCGI